MQHDKDTDRPTGIAEYIWRITWTHTVAYFIAGIFALVAVNYRDLYATDVIGSFMRPVDEPIVACGPALQLLRGVLIAMILLPLRKVFFEEKRGLLKLGVIVFGMSLLSTIGPTMGSFDGYIYTKVPVLYQILGYPEAVVYTLLFIGLLALSAKYRHRKIITILSVVSTVLIVLMGVLGYLSASGNLPA